MKFIVLGDAKKLISNISASGGEVVQVFNSQDAEKLKDPELRLPQADYLLNYFSPHILRPHVLNKFKDRALNIHNGKLPQYAGIHVHQWAIRNGETETAVTVHLMTSDVDGGDILAERSLSISENDTGLSLYKKTLTKGTELMSDVVDTLLSKGQIDRIQQNYSDRMIYTHSMAVNSVLDWSQPAEKVRNFIRAGSYFPFTSPTYTAKLDTANYGEILILQASVEEACGWPGQLIDVNSDGPLIACGDKSLRLKKVKSFSSSEIDWHTVFKQREAHDR